MALYFLPGLVRLLLLLILLVWPLLTLNFHVESAAHSLNNSTVYLMLFDMVQ